MKGSNVQMCLKAHLNILAKFLLYSKYRSSLFLIIYIIQLYKEGCIIFAYMLACQAIALNSTEQIIHFSKYQQHYLTVH